MNSFSIFAFLLCVALSYSAPADSGDVYSNKYDNFNIPELLKNKRLLQRYVDCVVNGQGCTAEGTFLREHLPEALKTNCAKCTEKQRNGAILVMNGMEKDHPDQLKRILDKFDPQRKLWAAFKKANLSAN